MDTKYDHNEEEKNHISPVKPRRMPNTDQSQANRRPITGKRRTQNQHEYHSLFSDWNSIRFTIIFPPHLSYQHTNYHQHINYHQLCVCIQITTEGDFMCRLQFPLCLRQQPSCDVNQLLFEIYVYVINL